VPSAITNPLRIWPDETTDCPPLISSMILVWILAPASLPPMSIRRAPLKTVVPLRLPLMFVSDAPLETVPLLKCPPLLTTDPPLRIVPPTHRAVAVEQVAILVDGDAGYGAAGIAQYAIAEKGDAGRRAAMLRDQGAVSRNGHTVGGPGPDDDLAAAEYLCVLKFSALDQQGHAAADDKSALDIAGRDNSAAPAPRSSDPGPCRPPVR